jgi:hypothetical protein
MLKINAQDSDRNATALFDLNEDLTGKFRRETICLPANR